MKIKVNVRIQTNAVAVIDALNMGASGKTEGGIAIVGPSQKAWYGQIHEFGGTIHPPRPFMRPALKEAQNRFPEQFRNCMTGVPPTEPALLKAAQLVADIAKKSMHAGNGIPSDPGEPPHIQSGNLVNSIRAQIVPLNAKSVGTAQATKPMRKQSEKKQVSKTRKAALAGWKTAKKYGKIAGKLGEKATKAGWKVAKKYGKKAAKAGWKAAKKYGKKAAKAGLKKVKRSFR